MQMLPSYSAGPSPNIVLNALQQSFLSVQKAFSALNLVLNTSKTKVMWFGKKNASEYNTHSESHSVIGPKTAHIPGLLLFSVCWNELKKNYTQTGPFYLFIQRLNRVHLLTVVAASGVVLLSLPSCGYLCLIMFVWCFVLLPCCVAIMLLWCVSAMLCSCLRSHFMSCYTTQRRNITDYVLFCVCWGGWKRQWGLRVAYGVGGDEYGVGKSWLFYEQVEPT
jgi:hypothetical protein